MDYRDYQKARDATWKILIDLQVCALPIQITEVCEKLNIYVQSYQKIRYNLQALGLDELASRTDGFTLYVKGRPVIFYDDSKPKARCRFTVAHELGHIMLGHIKPGMVTTVNQEPNKTDQPAEQAANVFAARLLAPACILWGLNIHAPDEIAQLAQISQQAATFRAERMDVLYRREQQFLHERGYSCFLLSHLERQVYQQFQPFIKSYNS